MECDGYASMQIEMNINIHLMQHLDMNKFQTVNQNLLGITCQFACLLHSYHVHSATVFSILLSFQSFTYMIFRSYHQIRQRKYTRR